MSDTKTLYARHRQFEEAGRMGNVVTWMRECQRTIAIVVAVTALYGVVFGLIAILTDIPVV